MASNSEADAQEHSNLARTPLHGLHLEYGARMVPFAGYEMPVQYPGGIIYEHKHTRSLAGLFDVSHMGQIRLDGADAAAALESLVPMDIAGLGEMCQRYALFTNPRGGIQDDLMVTNAGDHLFLVVNAACKAQDIAYLRTHLAGRCGIHELADRALMALQGPAAADVLGRFAPQLRNMLFMTAAHATLAGAECFVTRSGYTGEDGFEISVPAGRAEELARLLLAEDEVAPVGLGARDSLRLEAGLCLYGHDIDETTTPVEAALVWAIQKVRRRRGSREGGFPGAEIILRQIEDGARRKRVGLLPEGRTPVREGAELTTSEGRVVGRVTSGGFGPSVGGPVAMGYVEADCAEPGTLLGAMVRGRALPVAAAKMPFVQRRYYRA